MINNVYPLSVTEKSDTIGPVSFDGPTPKLLALEDKLSDDVSFKNIGCGGIGPLILDKPSHIFRIKKSILACLN